jgi:hypothetical protein
MGQRLDRWDRLGWGRGEQAKTYRQLNMLNRSDKALRTSAFGALVDVMHEAWLARFRFGAGKAHLGAASHALRFFADTRGLALWHCPPHEWLMAPGKLRFHN